MTINTKGLLAFSVYRTLNILTVFVVHFRIKSKKVSLYLILLVTL